MRFFDYISENTNFFGEVKNVIIRLFTEKFNLASNFSGALASVSLDNLNPALIAAIGTGVFTIGKRIYELYLMWKEEERKRFAYEAEERRKDETHKAELQMRLTDFNNQEKRKQTEFEKKIETDEGIHE